MAQLADYKVINDTPTHIASNQSQTFDFILSDNVIQSGAAQRPYFLITETLSGGLPGTVSLSLNGQQIESREGDANQPLNYSLQNLRVVLFDGSLLNSGQNSLTYSVTTQYDLRCDLYSLIVHFQRNV
ncbi:hypothetical protein [Paraglaciecola aestuariivivens]